MLCSLPYAPLTPLYSPHSALWQVHIKNRNHFHVRLDNSERMKVLTSYMLFWLCESISIINASIYYLDGLKIQNFLLSSAWWNPSDCWSSAWRFEWLPETPQRHGWFERGAADLEKGPVWWVDKRHPVLDWWELVSNSLHFVPSSWPNSYWFNYTWYLR